MNDLEKLLYLRGVAAEYFNYSGERTVVFDEVRHGLLSAVGYQVSDVQATRQAIFELDALPWKSWMRPFNIVSLGEAEYLDIRVHPDEKFSEFRWQLDTEAGELISGTLVPGQLPEVGDYSIEGVRYSAHRYALPPVPIGYHQIVLSSQRQQAQATVVVVPPRCFELDAVSSEQLWGLSCQLYTLRSERNWGIGDFSDLLELIGYCADAGMDFVALNPLHAPHMAGADFASPYSPSDRRFLNPLYVDPMRVQDFTDSEALKAAYDNRAYRQKLADLRAVPLVDYDGVTALKYAALEALFQHFLGQHLQPHSPRAESFKQFVRQQGEPLAEFSQYESRHSGLSFDSASDPRFHQYLQWIAQQQLQQCQALALKSGMSVGLMRDLAVGAVSGGSEVEGQPGLFSDTATIGAPPDQFARQGQNWNLPALDPIALKRDNYKHFIELIRANMRHCGALRIDHVMGLLRLWWCLPEMAGGAYVYYPLEDLLAILRLESHRQECVIVGEDMGVVPDELRARMAATAVYSNKVFYFERTADQQFKQPGEHQKDALLMVTNHDVSTLAGWWQAADLRIRSEIGLLNPERELSDLMRQRHEDKVGLLNWLESQNVPGAGGARDNLQFDCEQAFTIELCGAILTACARSRSRMMSFQLDDLQLVQEPVNIPGTYREYPNWRRKQPTETATIFANAKIKSLLSAIYRERKQ